MVARVKDLEETESLSKNSVYEERDVELENKTNEIVYI